MRAGYGFVSWLARSYFRLMYGLAVHGLENLPRTGRIIIASNHRSNFDPPILGGIVPREVHFFAKEELFRKPLFARFIRYLNAFPVRRGQFDRESLAVCLNVLKARGRADLLSRRHARSGGWLFESEAGARLGGLPVRRSGRSRLHSRQRDGAATASARTGREFTWSSASRSRRGICKPAGLRGKDQYQHVSDRSAGTDPRIVAGDSRRPGAG